jgi:hypothetical protein
MMVLASAIGPGLTGSLIDLGVAYETQILAMAGYCFVTAIAMGIVSARVRRRLVSTAIPGIAGRSSSR